MGAPPEGRLIRWDARATAAALAASAAPAAVKARAVTPAAAAAKSVWVACPRIGQSLPALPGQTSVMAQVLPGPFPARAASSCERTNQRWRSQTPNASFLKPVVLLHR